MINLLHETETAIAESGHSPHDIVFIGSVDSGHQCGWEEFKLLADVEYNNGPGWTRVATDLIIVFSDGERLRRGENNGREWWEHIANFRPPKDYIPITHVVSPKNREGWLDLEDMNEAE